MPKTSSILLAALLFASPCSTLIAQASPNRSFSDLESGVDSTIRPGDDFFGWANGGWLKSTEIPTGLERWSARLEINQITQGQLARVLEDADQSPAGSLGRKVADYRAAYANQAAIEKNGLKPLRPLLDSIDRLSNKTQLAARLGKNVGADVDPLNWGIYRSSWLLGLSVEPSIHGEKTYVAFLLQGGLGLPDRENYTSTEPRMVALRGEYQHYIGHMLRQAGLADADRRAAAVMRLETALAASQASREASANDRNSDNVWNRDEFDRSAPGMDWTAFLSAAGLGQVDRIGVWQPAALKGLATQVSAVSLDVWKDYLRFHLLDRHSGVLPSTFAEAARTMHGNAAGADPDRRPRDQQAADATQLAMSDAIGRMYVDRYFAASQRTRLETMVANVLAAFHQRLNEVTWMSPASKAQAHKKIANIYFGVVQPPRSADYSQLQIDPTDPVGNQQRVAEMEYRRNLARLHQPVDPTDWWIAPQRVAAVLNFQQNSYNFPAGLLQAPKFDPAASDAANYGAIGAIVGHEISHFVDRLGADWDSDYRMRHWWTAEDSVGFERSAAPLVAQLGGYQPEPGLAVNGEFTLTESVADLAGLATAFEAYRKALGPRSSDGAYVRQQDREFFIGFARSWRGKIRDGAMAKVLTTDNHPPERYRIATVRNLDAWYSAFDVRPGDRLYLPKAERVRVW